MPTVWHGFFSKSRTQQCPNRHARDRGTAVTIVGEKTYSRFAAAIHAWMKQQRLVWPMEMFDRLRRVMGKDAPSYSQCKMVFRGRRIFEPYVILFMKESLNFDIDARDCFPDEDGHGNVTKIKGQLWFRARGIR